MRTARNVMLAPFAAAMLLAFSVGAASANRLSASESNGKVIFAPLTIEAAGRNIACSLTLSGSLAGRTFTKTERQLVSFTGAELTTCSGGTATMLTETLPWTMQYVGFSGTLPNITSIRSSLIGVALKVRTAEGLVCLAGTTSRNPGFGELLLSGAGQITGYRVDERVGIPLGGGFVCEIAGEAHASGTGSVTTLIGGGITVRLI